MAARFRDIVSTHAVSAYGHLADWVLLDCRFDLVDKQDGARRFAEGHLPGAVYADLEKDLSSPVTSTSGRHPLPDPDVLADRFGEWGIGNNTQVVAYDDCGGAFAARAWWLLKWLGHEHVAVLDGGIGQWQLDGLPLSTQVRPQARQRFTPQLQADSIVATQDLASALAGGAILLDARTAERFMGDSEPLDLRAGHIPGAHNHPFAANLDHTGRFLSTAELRECFDAACCGRKPTEVISMCGSGVTACHNLLAMSIAGLSGGKLYPGSWSEWCRDPARPVATGPDRGC